MSNRARKPHGKVEEFSPFDKARLNNGVPDLNEQFCNILLVEVEKRIARREEAESAMEFVLDLNGVGDPDRRHAYKSFFGHTWAARRRNRIKDRDAREFAPVDEDGNQQ
ncbi:MAG TPA: hypothetical protein VG934_01205 [Candidatus Paceibacterota bacterium]|nr:hypothetical protein [Candidatus Paceibacterota bacterium]